MTGRPPMKRSGFPAYIALAAVVGLAACDENGEFAFPGSAEPAAGAANGAPSVQAGTTSRDVERPDIFEVTDRGLWDGRPSLGGVWVAHPDVQDPDRVIIRNPANGQSVEGALFRRERENPGPLLQVSSDAAEALGILAGAPTELNVVVLRREEVEVEATPEVNPVIADLQAPVSVESAPLDPVENAAAAIDAAETATPAVDVVLPPATAAGATSAAAAANETPTVAPTPTVSVPDGPLIQIGVFSVQANADAAATQITTAGVETLVLPEEVGGRTVWRVVSGAGLEQDAREQALTQVKELGFVDAFVIDG